MSVNVRFIGRLGNQLFQYAIGRIIAEHFSFELNCREVSKPIKHGGSEVPVATLADFLMYCSNAPLHIPGIAFSTPVDSIEIDGPEKWQGHLIDLESIRNNHTDRQIRLHGYFQRYEYYQPYRDRIREWFKFDSVPTSFQIRESDILVNIRRGRDFGFNNWVLPLTYYEDLLSNLTPIGRIFVCGTGIDRDLEQRLKKYRPIYFHGSPVEHFSFISRFNRIIMSNSTFTWWAAFLSDANELYAPRSVSGLFYAFTGYRDVDLNMREPRYKEVEVKESARMRLCLQNQCPLELLRRRDGRIQVASLNNASSFLLIEEAHSDFVVWLAEQNRPLALDELQDRYRGADFDLIVGSLVHSGILRIVPTYLD